MATIPKKWTITSSNNLDNIDKINGQVIALWDTDAVYYDVPNNGTKEGGPVRRQVSGIKVIDSLVPFIERAGGNPDDPRYKATVPMNDILYVYIPTNQDEQEILPSSNPAQPLYDLRVWVGDVDTGSWVIVGTNRDDINVKTTVADTASVFYLTGCANSAEDTSTLVKTPKVSVELKEINGVLTSILHADTFDGTITNAQNAVQADTAVKAIHDEKGTDITSYIHAVDSKYEQGVGTTFTFKNGLGAKIEPSILAKDTDYKVFTEDANKTGLVNGIATTVNEDNTGLILSGSGWINTGKIVMPLANSAVHDAASTPQRIDQTYVKGATFNNSTRNLIFTLGNGNSGGAVNIPDTTYNVFTANTPGLAPGTTSGDDAKFLRGDARWVALPVFAGSTSGMVPAANAQTDGEKYLKGNGTWGTTFSQGNSGLVPAPTAGEANSFLKGDGTWSSSADTKNTAGANQDTAQLYVIGAKGQTAGTNGTQTYSNAMVYINDGKLHQSSDSSVTDTFTGDGVETTFELGTEGATAITTVMIDSVAVTTGFNLDTSTNSIVFTTAPTTDAEIEVTYTIPVTAVQVVDVESTQTLSNKKFSIDGNEYSIGTACARTASDAVYPSTSEEFEGDGTTTVFNFSQEVVDVIEVTVAGTELPDTDFTIDNSQTPNTITFNSAPANEAVIVVSFTTEDSDALPSNGAVISYVAEQIATVANLANNKVDNPVIAGAYDDTHQYNVDDFCMFQATGDDGVKLYRCKTQTASGGEAFTPSHWESTTVIDAIKHLISQI